ncbi:hypothetical protein HYT00_02670 [Candidatus Giovannonibacteria bacterium]|nr:hypothetical protein [Candidatus Giovannonibacteria bacterium]
MKKLLNKKNIIILIIFILLVGGVFYYKNFRAGEGNQSKEEYPFTNPEFKERYEDPENKFFVDYPEDYTVNEMDNGDNIKTIVFEKKNSGQPAGEAGESFQIFSMPFDEESISVERILIDSPDMVIKDPQEITIAGGPALLFFSTDPDVGDVRELWFVRDDHLYQASTFAAYDELLSKIMKTFTFK